MTSILITAPHFVAGGTIGGEFAPILKSYEIQKRTLPQIESLCLEKGWKLQVDSPDYERSYRIQERLGTSCGDQVPTEQEEMLAKLTVAKEMAQIEKLNDLNESVEKWNK